MREKEEVLIIKAPGQVPFARRAVSPWAPGFSREAPVPNSRGCVSHGGRKPSPGLAGKESFTGPIYFKQENALSV